MSDYSLLICSFILPILLLPFFYLFKGKRSRFIIMGIIFYLWQVALVSCFSFLIARFVLRAENIGFITSYGFGFLVCLVLSGVRILLKTARSK
ncbi:MAG: hypothetical protein KIT80_19630 [Chitinophagaceae bacterium]|nr:hypothetical protein [Chitinophagaceae bacterium]MCW5929140.1 hypothetical protein [Chitinophagaceae bacterium]